MNVKKYCKDLLSASTELSEKLGSGKILAAYPNEVKNFPLVVYEDMNTRDVAFSDNLPEGTNASVRVHIFSKTVKGYPTTNEIGEIIHSIFRLDYWAMSVNQELSDVEDNVKHRVMDFTRDFYSL